MDAGIQQPVAAGCIAEQAITAGPVGGSSAESGRKSWVPHSCAFFKSVFQKAALCQGTTSVVSKRAGKQWALALEGLQLISAESFLKHAVAQGRETSTIISLSRYRLDDMYIKAVRLEKRAICMATETTYTALRASLASYLDRVTDDREVVIVRRRGARDVAIVPADELSSLMETAHLLRSPKNAERLLESFRELEQGGGEVMTMEELRRSAGLDKAS
jgi:antitoxin YefM